jgi:8-oxo-dGTP pyrophosphatase MutT (NUDIX family)
MNERWRPSVTVAAVIEHEGRFLLVEEHTPEGLRLNNPAGHLEPGETPLQAVVREALEETARTFVPEALLGVYLARFVRPAVAAASAAASVAGEASEAEDITYLRFAYAGRVGEALPGRALDTGIVRTLWLTREEIAHETARHRSPLVMRCIDDHLAGQRHPLGLVKADSSLIEPRILARP